jgi:uncharacterized protein
VPPILHLSLPVRDLDEGRAFYAEVLGCRIGRETGDFVDVWFHGLQLTLHDRPDEVQPVADQGVRHFGVTLPPDELDALVARIDGAGVAWVVPVGTDLPGTPREQTKGKVADPSGNVIELKTYPDLASALGYDERG